jgi:SAM-dependent methyltransferase
MTGADLSPASIEAAKRKAQLAGRGEVRFLTTDAETLEGVPDSAFDGAVSFSALRYVPNLDKALAAIFRVLKPGGVAALDFPNRYCPWFKILKNRVGVETHIHDHQYGAGEIARCFKAAGFRDVRIGHLLFTSYLTPNALLPAFRLFDRIGERTPLLRRTAAILMVRGVKP